MNIPQLRQSLKNKWLNYYAENREWVTRIGVWVNCGEQRRPSSSFILATLSTLEPQLTQMLPLIVELSNNPDRIVAALGLNFNPDEQLATIAKEREQVAIQESLAKMLPAAPEQVEIATAAVSNLIAKMDESCQGVSGQSD